MFLCLESPSLICKTSKLDDTKCTHHIIGDNVPKINQPSLETFSRDFLKPKIPVKITGRVLTINFHYKKVLLW